MLRAAKSVTTRVVASNLLLLAPNNGRPEWRSAAQSEGVGFMGIRILGSREGAGLFSRSSTRSDCTIHKVRRSRTVLLLSQRSSPNGRLCWRLVFRRSRSHAESRCDSQTVLRGSHEQASSLQVLASSCETPPISGMGDTGLEPVTPSLSSWCSNQLS